MVTSRIVRLAFLACFFLGPAASGCTTEIVTSTSTSASSGVSGGGGAGGAMGQGGQGGHASCPSAGDACQACMIGIDACGPLELCLNDGVCSPQWEGFKACEGAGKDFPQCINLLTAGPELELKGAAFCEGACAGVNAGCKAKSPAAACAQCCAASHANGFSTYSLVAYNCACATCDAGCVAATCQENQPPGDACVTCVQSSLLHDCDGDSAFQTNCGGAVASDCADYVSCILNCG